jgi:hypothetical protein
MIILAQTDCYCKFNIEAQTRFCLFLPAASAAGRKFKAPALRVVVVLPIAHGSGKLRSPNRAESG